MRVVVLSFEGDIVPDIEMFERMSYEEGGFVRFHKCA